MRLRTSAKPRALTRCMLPQPRQRTLGARGWTGRRKSVRPSCRSSCQLTAVRVAHQRRMPSPSLVAKIAKQRAAAPSDLPLVRRCAGVVLAWLAQKGEGSADLRRAIAQLREEHGSNWSLITALQLLSGRRGQFAAECGCPDERGLLYLAHLGCEVRGCSWALQRSGSSRSVGNCAPSGASVPDDCERCVRRLNARDLGL